MINNINMIVSVSLSYLLSIGLNKITEKGILKYLMNNGYAIKEGNKELYYEEVDKPNYKITCLIRNIPYLNVITTIIEGATNILAVEEVKRDLINKEIITKMSIEEIKEYSSISSFTIAEKIIHTKRKIEKNETETYEIQIHTTKEQMQESKIDKYEELNKIERSNIDTETKIKLLEILKFSIEKNIDNLNIDNLIKETKYEEYNIFKLYYNLFSLKDTMDQNSIKKVLYILNKTINLTNIEHEVKSGYISQIYVGIIEALNKTKKRN